MHPRTLALTGLLTLGGCRDDPPPATSGATGTGTTAGSPPSTAGVDGTATGGGPDVPADVAAPAPVCDDYDPARALYWGDLHVHTAYSFDAWLHDVRLDPDQAYRFARGEAVMLPPLDPGGRPTQRAQLDRPLDFVAVTDHAEFLAEVEACTIEGSAAYETPLCVDYRANQNGALVSFGVQLGLADPMRFAEICGEGAVDCPALAQEDLAAHHRRGPGPLRRRPPLPLHHVHRLRVERDAVAVEPAPQRDLPRGYGARPAALLL